MQIVSRQDGVLVLDVAALQEVLPTNIGHKKIKVISIIGMTGMGKSLMVNMCASYLEHLESGVSLK